MPGPEWLRTRYPQEKWTSAFTANVSIGQGYVLTTPLQLAVMAARVATGKAVVPVLVRPREGAVPATFASLGLAPASLDAIRSGMIACVNESGGTGIAARCFSGFRAEDTDTDSTTEGGEGDCKCFGKHI